jgi:serine/threonine protein phosphatase PrpC
LCSDGVNAMLSDGEIRAALSTETAEEAAWELVERANRAGGHDNITALVVDVRP